MIQHLRQNASSIDSDVSQLEGKFWKWISWRASDDCVRGLRVELRPSVVVIKFKHLEDMARDSSMSLDAIVVSDCMITWVINQHFMLL